MMLRLRLTNSSVFAVFTKYKPVPPPPTVLVEYIPVKLAVEAMAVDFSIRRAPSN